MSELKPNLTNLCCLCWNWRASKCKVYKKRPQICRRFRLKLELKQKNLLRRGVICGAFTGFWLGLLLGVLI